MRVFFSVLFFLGFGASVNATEVILQCSNVGNSIQLDFKKKLVSINTTDDQTLTFKFGVLDRTVGAPIPVASEVDGCRHSEKYVVKMTFKLVDGSPMPNSLTVASDSDGSLSDYFLCEKSSILVSPAGTCN